MISPEYKNISDDTIKTLLALMKINCVEATEAIDKANYNSNKFVWDTHEFSLPGKHPSTMTQGWRNPEIKFIEKAIEKHQGTDEIEMLKKCPDNSIIDLFIPIKHGDSIYYLPAKIMGCSVLRAFNKNLCQQHPLANIRPDIGNIRAATQAIAAGHISENYEVLAGMNTKNIEHLIKCKDILTDDDILHCPVSHVIENAMNKVTTMFEDYIAGNPIDPDNLNHLIPKFMMQPLSIIGSGLILDTPLADMLYTDLDTNDANDANDANDISGGGGGENKNERLTMTDIVEKDKRKRIIDKNSDSMLLHSIRSWLNAVSNNSRDAYEKYRRELTYTTSMIKSMVAIKDQLEEYGGKIQFTKFSELSTCNIPVYRGNLEDPITTSEDYISRLIDCGKQTLIFHAGPYLDQIRSVMTSKMYKFVFGANPNQPEVMEIVRCFNRNAVKSSKV